jgi:hypothetical protein
MKTASPCSFWQIFIERIVAYTRAIHRMNSESSQNIQPSRSAQASAVVAPVFPHPVKDPPTKEGQTQNQTKKDRSSKSNKKPEQSSASPDSIVCISCGRKGHTREKCFGSKHPNFNSTKEKAWAEHDTTPYDVLSFKKQLSGKDLPQEHLEEMGKLLSQAYLVFQLF